MKRHELAVIEGRWFKKKNQSVRPVFDSLVDLLYGTPHAYFHHQFSSAAALGHVIAHVASTDARFLYIGAHGDDAAIYGSIGDDEGKVSRTQLRNVLWKCWDEGVGDFDGLFLGSCSFVTPENAEYILCGEKAPKKLKWIAGYSRDADWVDSTLLDTLFLRRVLALDGTPVDRVKACVESLEAHAGGLCQELGFNVYVRKVGPGGGVKPLLDY